MHTLLLLVLLLPAASPAAISPAASAAANALIAAEAEAAVAAGQPAKWLVTFRTEQQAASQAQAAGWGTAAELAHPSAYAAVKARVLDLARSSSPTASVVTEAGAAAQAQAQPLPRAPVQVLADYSHLPITFVSISSAAELARLRASPDVASVTPNGIAHTMGMEGLAMIGQPAAAARGLVGTGSVAVIDTGLDFTRSVFGPCTAPGVPAATCRVVHMADMTAADDGLLDAGILHGTNVAGIIATVAPGVKLISLDVFGADGGAQWSDVIAAVDWAVANRALYNITAINMSLGAGSYTGACDDEPLAAAANSAFAQGVIPVAAAGNYGETDALLIPACASKAVSVGAVYADAHPGSPPACPGVTPQADTVACFSNSASHLTLWAPGVSITAAGITMSGTSMAAPFAAAALSVLHSRYPSHSPAQLVSLLTSTGVPVTDARNGITKPRLDLRAATGISTGSCTPTLSPGSVKAPSTGGTFTITITPPSADCPWSAGDLAASWLHVVGASSGTGPGTITLRVDPIITATATATARSTGVSVAAGEDDAGRALVSQAVLAAASSDTRPPAMSRLQGSTSTTTAGSLSLVWRPARDTQSGVSGYRVVYNEGIRPPSAWCTSGTPVEEAPVLSGSRLRLNVAGLAAKARYSFRVCAIDAAGNVSAGTVCRVVG